MNIKGFNICFHKNVIKYFKDSNKIEKTEQKMIILLKINKNGFTNKTLKILITWCHSFK